MSEHTFSQLNGDELTTEQVRKRAKMIEEIVHQLTTTNCCKEYPNWEQLLYRATYEKLCNKYRNLFGRDVE